MIPAVFARPVSWVDQVDLGLPSRVKLICSSDTVEIFWRCRFHYKSFQVDIPVSNYDSATARGRKLTIRRVLVLVSAWPNNIGYWVLGSFFGIILTLITD